jgi:hypothetical protein
MLRTIDVLGAAVRRGVVLAAGALLVIGSGCAWDDEPLLSDTSAAIAPEAPDPVLAAIVSYALERARGAGTDTDAWPEPRDPARYRLEAFDSVDVDRHVVIGDDSTGLPEELHGLWWMHGNPLPDKVLTFGGSPWNAEQRTTRIVVYDEGVWTWHGDLAGTALYAWVRHFELVYELSYDEDVAFAVIVPTVRIGGVRVRVPESVVKLTAQRLSDGLWLRLSYLGGHLVHAYALRRIVTGDGQRESAYDEYVAAAPPLSLVAERVD